MSLRLRLDDVTAARAVVAPHLPPVPLRPSLAAPGVDLRLKLECWQPTGSFKVRGALNVLASLTAHERARGVVAASAGNHALGVAYAAERLGGAIRATLFVPRTAPRAKLEKLRRFPVEVHERGETYDDAVEAAESFQRETGAILVEAFEDARTAAGQGICGLELLEQCPAPAAVVVPVGGGGLFAGVATVVKSLSPRTRVVAVQPDASPAFSESLRLGQALLKYQAAPTLADGLAGGIGRIAYEHRDLVDDSVIVSEVEIEQAMVALLAADQVVAEASAAVAVAAVRSGRMEADGPVIAILTGGNVDVARARAAAGDAPRRATGVRRERPGDRVFATSLAGLAVAGAAGIGALSSGFAGAAAGTAVGVGVGLVAQYGLRRRSRRRQAALASPFPATWRDFLIRQYDHFERLDGAWRARFEDDLRLFLAEKRITGIGVEVDDELRLLVAASAVSLSVGWPNYEWDQLTEVLLYPDDFDRDYAFGGTDRAGETHPWGTVILSVPALLESFEFPDDAYHVGLHEFAHLLDVDQTHFDGIPVGLDAVRSRAWVAEAEREMERLRRGRSAFDDYGANDPVEFLGVAVEAFFEVPQVVRRRHRGVYEILSAYFAQDPAAWDDERGLRE